MTTPTDSEIAAAARADCDHAASEINRAAARALTAAGRSAARAAGRAPR